MPSPVPPVHLLLRPILGRGFCRGDSRNHTGLRRRRRRGEPGPAALPDARPPPAWTIGPLRVETLREGEDGRLRYKLIEPLRVRAALGGAMLSGLRITVPAGFETDLASVPRFFWRWFPPAGDYAAAAVVHDWFYRHPSGISRFLADAIFRDLMAALGVPAWKRWLMWAAVRLNSWRYWQ